MESKEKLKRVLTFSDVLAYGLLYFVPMAPIAVFGIIYNSSQGMVALTYLVAASAMIFSAISYSEIAKKIPLSGSVYSYVSKGVNPFVGFIAGWAILLDYLLLPAVLAIFGAAALVPLFPNVDKAVWLFAFVAVPMIVNIFGIQMSARLGKILLMIQLVVLFVFMIFALTRIAQYGITAEQLLAPLYNPDYFGFKMAFAAVPIAALSFIGFDAISTLNEEAIGGGEAVSKATMVLLVVVTFLFCAQVYFAAIFVPMGTLFHESEVETAFYIVSTKIVGQWFLPVVTLTNAIIAILANALVSQATTSKVIFNMARDKRLPVVLSKLNKRGAPFISIITVAIASFIIGMVGLDKSDIMVTLVTFGALTAYAMLNFTVLWYFRGHSEKNTFIHVISPIIGIIILLFALFSADPLAKKLGIAWIIFGVVVTFLLNRANKLKDIDLDL